MSNDIKLIDDVETGIIEIVELTTAEQKARDKEVADFEKQKAAELAIIAQKEIQRQAILDRLGLTADEAKLLLG